MMIGLEASNALPPLFSLSTKEKTPTYTHFGNRGQGPEEFIWPHSIQYIDENTFGVYDGMLKVYREITVLRNGSLVRIVGQSTISSRLFSVIKTAYNQYVGLSEGENLMVLMDSTGREIASFFEYPFQNENEHAIKNHMRAMAYQGYIVANPQKTKFVYAASVGEIIHFYGIQKDKISLIDKIEEIYPSYKPIENELFRGSMRDWTNMVGSLSCGNRPVYIRAVL
jgi:hypothetical protein